MSTTPDPFRPEDTPPPQQQQQPYPPQYGAPAGYAAAQPLTPQEEKNWSLGAHLGPITGQMQRYMADPAEIDRTFDLWREAFTS